MNKIILLTIIIFCSCSKKKNPILGTWKVKSNFYKATCKILEEDKNIKGLVLFYDDNTTVYKYSANKPKKYFFNNLKGKSNSYIDATSGATKTRKLDTTNLTLIHKDTLEITTYTMNKPLKEIWIRNNK